MMCEQTRSSRVEVGYGIDWRGQERSWVWWCMCGIVRQAGGIRGLWAGSRGVAGLLRFNEILFLTNENLL